MGVVTTSTWLGSLWMVIFLALSLLAAWIVWRLIERPGQRVVPMRWAEVASKATQKPLPEQTGDRWSHRVPIVVQGQAGEAGL
jgi:peptidoglycan/LPS O-acetylase OafA/YrhL